LLLTSKFIEGKNGGNLSPGINWGSSSKKMYPLPLIHLTLDFITGAKFSIGGKRWIVWDSTPELLIFWFDRHLIHYYFLFSRLTTNFILLASASIGKQIPNIHLFG